MISRNVCYFSKRATKIDPENDETIKRRMIGRTT